MNPIDGVTSTDGGGGNTEPPVPLPPGGPKAYAFFGSAEVKAPTTKARLMELADEIIALLGQDPHGTVKITLPDQGLGAQWNRKPG